MVPVITPVSYSLSDFCTHQLPICCTTSLRDIGNKNNNNNKDKDKITTCKTYNSVLKESTVQSGDKHTTKKPIERRAFGQVVITRVRTPISSI